MTIQKKPKLMTEEILSKSVLNENAESLGVL